MEPRDIRREWPGRLLPERMARQHRPDLGRFLRAWVEGPEQMRAEHELERHSREERLTRREGFVPHSRPDAITPLWELPGRASNAAPATTQRRAQEALSASHTCEAIRAWSSFGSADSQSQADCCSASTSSGSNAPNAQGDLQREEDLPFADSGGALLWSSSDQVGRYDEQPSLSAHTPASLVDVSSSTSMAAWSCGRQQHRQKSSSARLEAFAPQRCSSSGEVFGRETGHAIRAGTLPFAEPYESRSVPHVSMPDVLLTRPSYLYERSALTRGDHPRQHLRPSRQRRLLKRGDDVLPHAEDVSLVFRNVASTPSGNPVDQLETHRPQAPSSHFWLPGAAGDNLKVSLGSVGPYTDFTNAEPQSSIKSHDVKASIPRLRTAWGGGESVAAIIDYDSFEVGPRLTASAAKAWRQAAERFSSSTDVVDEPLRAFNAAACCHLPLALACHRPPQERAAILQEVALRLALSRWRRLTGRRASEGVGGTEDGARARVPRGPVAPGTRRGPCATDGTGACGERPTAGPPPSATLKPSSSHLSVSQLATAIPRVLAVRAVSVRSDGRAVFFADAGADDRVWL